MYFQCHFLYISLLLYRQRYGKEIPKGTKVQIKMRNSILAELQCDKYVTTMPFVIMCSIVVTDPEVGTAFVLYPDGQVEGFFN